MKEIDTQYTWAPNQAYILFASTFINTSGSIVNYSGTLFSEPEKEEASQPPSYRMWYMDAKNEITEGHVLLSPNGDWSLKFTSGVPLQAYRVDIVRLSVDSYRWSLQIQDGDTWKPVFSLDYLRSR